MQCFNEPCRHNNAVSLLYRECLHLIMYKKEELTDEMPQANDIILAGDIKVDRGSFLAESLLRTFYD